MSSNLILQRVCEYCNKPFTAYTTKTRYCSKSCNSRDYKSKIRNEKLNISKVEFKQKVLESPHNIILLNIKPYLNIKETCLLLNASDSTIRKMIKEGVLPTMRIGVKHVIRKSDIDKLFTY